MDQTTSAIICEDSEPERLEYFTSTHNHQQRANHQHHHHHNRPSSHSSSTSPQCLHPESVAPQSESIPINPSQLPATNQTDSLDVLISSRNADRPSTVRGSCHPPPTEDSIGSDSSSHRKRFAPCTSSDTIGLLTPQLVSRAPSSPGVKHQCPPVLDNPSDGPEPRTSELFNDTTNLGSLQAGKTKSHSAPSDTDHSADSRKSDLSRFMYKQSLKSHKSDKSSTTNRKSLHANSTKSNSHSNSSSDESLDIPYQTLTQLKSCPSCSNPWTTYKAPRSKLNHIKKCAQTNMIEPKNITLRVQRLLDKQAQSEANSNSLLDLHIKKKSIHVTVVETGAEIPSGSKNVIHTHSRPSLLPVDHLHQSPNARTFDKNSSRNLLNTITAHSNTTSAQQGSSLVPKPSTSHTLHQRDDSKPHSSNLDKRDRHPPHSPRRNPSSVLAQAESLGKTRNSSVATNGPTPYSLWDVAGGHDGYDYQRSQSEGSERDFQDVSNLNNCTSDIEVSVSLSNHVHDPDCDSTDAKRYDQHDSRGDLSTDPSIPDNRPCFEDWTRKDLVNENERLGFADANGTSTSRLIQRAIHAWKDTALEIAQLQKRNILFSSGTVDAQDSDNGGMGPSGEVIDSDPQIGRFVPSSESDCRVQGGSSTGDFPVEEVEAYASGSKPRYRNSSSSEEFGAEGVEKTGVATHIAATSVYGNGDENFLEQGSSQLIHNPAMPDYSSYSKSALELEYFTLHTSRHLNPSSTIPSPPPMLPKTKLGILGRVIKLWKSIHDQEHPSEKPSHDTTIKKPKKKAVPKKKKLSPEEIHTLLSRVCQDDTEFYMQLLRYEPFKLSVFEEKVADALEIEHAKPIASLVVTKWLDWQALSYYTLDPTISRKRH